VARKIISRRALVGRNGAFAKRWISALEQKHDKQLKGVFQAIDDLLDGPDRKPKRKTGFV